MPSTCAVSNCPSNTHRCKKTRSTFRVPRDAEMRLKWIEAIPGQSILVPSQRICENHFEEHFIIREYVRHDQSGRILAQVPFKHPRLKKEAVPTLFTQNATTLRDEPVQQVLGNGKNFIDANTVYSHNEHTYCSTLRVPLREEGEEEEGEAIVVEGEEVIKVKEEDVVEVEEEEEAIEVEEEESIDLHVELRHDSPQYTVPIGSVEEIPQSIIAPISNCITFASVIFQFDKESGESIDEPMILPKPWNVCKSRVGAKEILLFTYSVVNNDHGVNRYIFEKTVAINSSREIQYDIYSTPVDVQGITRLPRSLDITKSLPEILKTFKDMRVCKGIGDVVVPANTDLKSYIGVDRRHTDCTLLSINGKRCTVCRRLSKVLSQKSRRMEKWKIQHGMSSPSDTVEQVKLRDLRKKMKLRTKTICRLKRRLELLAGSSTEQ